MDTRGSATGSGNGGMLRGNRARDAGLREFLTVLFKHKGRIIAVFVACVLCAVALSFLVPPVYEARSTVLIKLGREYVSNPGVGEVRPLLSLEQQEIVNSEIQILGSRELIEKVVKQLTVETVYPKYAKVPPAKLTPLDASILRFEKDLSVTGLRKSNVIQVSFLHRDPRVAARAVNLLVDGFREKHLKVFSDPQSSFLEGQLRIYKNKLGRAESTLESFKQKNQVFSLDEQRSLLLRQRTELDTALKNANHQIEELREKLGSLRKQRIESAEKNRTLYVNTERDKIIVDAQAKLLSLQLTEQELLKKYREDSRRVQDVRNEIRTVENFLRQQEESVSRKMETANPVFQGVEMEMIKTEADLSSQTAKAAALSRQLGILDREIRTLDLNERKFQELKREMSANEKYFRTYGDRLEEARIAEDMNRNKLANISVIQPAVVPVKPLRPKKTLNMAVGLFVGAFAGLGLALVTERLSQGLTTPDSAERRLGLPVLTSIPMKKT